jgi:hypothetical protein
LVYWEVGNVSVTSLPDVVTLEMDRPSMLDVQHGHRLVGEQDARVGGERAGERNPLTLASG